MRGEKSGLSRSLAEPGIKIIGYIVLAFMFIYILNPFVWLFLTAFNPHGSPFLELPENLALDNFIAIFVGTTKMGAAAHSIYMATWIKNSLIVAATTMFIVIVTSAMAGYALSRLDFPGKNLFMLGLLLIGFMPSLTKLLPLYKLCIIFGFVNNLFGVGIIIASGTLPTQIWVMKGFFDGIPRELEEQAWICGCNRLTSLFRVVLPAAGPGVMVVALMSFLSGWGNFTVPLILIRSEDLYPISLGIASIFTHHPGEVGLVVDYGVVAALSIIYMIPSLIIYYVVRRHLLKIRLARMEVR